MTDKQFDKFAKQLNKELETFEKEMLKQPKEEIYKSFYKIHSYHEIYAEILMKAEDMKRNEFPLKNILDYYYTQFMDSNYNLTPEELGYLIDNEVEYVKDYNKSLKDDEME